jgi:hypothetical protein
VINPLSKEFLLSRGYCCSNGCQNCPYTRYDFIKQRILNGEYWSSEKLEKAVNNKKISEAEATSLKRLQNLV